MSLRSHLEGVHQKACMAELEADLAAGPDLYQFLPFGNTFRAEAHAAARRQLNDDLSSPGLWWIFGE